MPGKQNAALGIHLHIGSVGGQVPLQFARLGHRHGGQPLLELVPFLQRIQADTMIHHGRGDKGIAQLLPQLGRHKNAPLRIDIVFIASVQHSRPLTFREGWRMKIRIAVENSVESVEIHHYPPLGCTFHHLYPL